MSEVKRGRVLEGYADESELAAEFNVAVQTLRSWRRRGAGPPWVKGPGGILYPVADAREWLRGNLVQPRAKTA